MCEKEPNWAKKDVDKWEQLIFNFNFLKKQNALYGDLHCEYCGKKNLKIYEWCEKVDLTNVATVDHFYPKSKYDNLKMDVNNFIISCYKCNNNKKDEIWDVNKIKYPINETKISYLKDIY